MSDPAIPPVITEAAVGEVTECRDKAVGRATGYQANADYEMAKAREFEAIRAWIAPRIGIPLADAVEEAAAELSRAENEVARAEQEADAAVKWLRDLEGHRRVLEQKVGLGGVLESCSNVLRADGGQE